MAFMLSKHLKALGVEVTTLTLEQSGSDAFDTLQPFRIQRIPGNDPRSAHQKVSQKIDFARHLRAAIKELKPDVILCAHWDPCAYVARIANSKVPYFLIVHGTEFVQLPTGALEKLVKKALRSFAFSGARRIFAVSNYTRERATRAGADPADILVIPNGVEEAEKSSSSCRPVTQDGEGIIVTVSRLVPRKGHDVMLRALPFVVQHFPHVIYRIVGDGPERDRLHALAQDLHVLSNVDFVGEVSQGRKNEILSACDVFVLACRETAADFEGFGIAILEAMEHGKPVVAARSGGIPDVVEDGVTGLLVPPDDVKALGDAVLSILCNPRGSSDMGKRGQQRVAENFRWPQIALRYYSEMRAAFS
jgi:phosphatidylinositol alpha-1,6-mannosyltransferase